MTSKDEDLLERLKVRSQQFWATDNQLKDNLLFQEVTKRFQQLLKELGKLE